MSHRYLCCLLTALTLQAQVFQQARGGRGGTAPAPPPPATDCAASGTVVNAITGEPIARAMVTMAGVPGNGSATDATGRWNISNIICGMRNLMATRAGYLAGNYRPNGSGAPQVVQLISGTPLRDLKIALTPEATISGRVQDQSGDPIEGAQIRVMRVMVQNGKRALSNAQAGNSDSQGNFRIGQLGAGRYLICANSPQVTYPVGGGSPWVYEESCFPGPASAGLSIAMPLEGGREIRTALTMRAVQGVHVRGTVAGFATAQLTRVQLMKMPNGSGPGFPGAQVGDDGTFDIPSVPPGSYMVRVNTQSVVQQAGRGGGMPLVAQTPVEVGNTDVNGVNLTFQPPGSLSGIVRYQFSGTATPQVNVSMIPTPASLPVGPMQWDPSHLNFTFPEVSVGEYRFNAGSGNPATYIKSAMLRGQNILNQVFTVSGTTGPVEIVVSDDTGGIDGAISDADGHPAPGWVILISATGQTTNIRSGDDGHVGRKNLPSGEYKAWAFDDITNVPWAEEEWMTRNAGRATKVTITTGGSASLTLKRVVIPPE